MDIVQPKKYKILLIGDNGIDQYQYGTVDRISPEAPVPILNFSHSESKPGMAANVKENLEALGCEVFFMHGVKTSVKTRVIDIRSKQQLLRIDQDSESKPIKLDYIDDGYDAIVVSDYNKGSVSYELIEVLRDQFTGPIFVDTKKTDLAKFEGCVIKINLIEYNNLITLPSVYTDVVVTHGDKGAVWGGNYFPAVPVEVSDVCGAGDTFLAALAFGYLSLNDMGKAIEFAIKASAITVQHVGVYAPTLEEVTKKHDN